MERKVPVSPWAEWEIIEKIGEGSFGKVYKAQCVTDGKASYSAIKMISIPSNENELESIRSENPDDRSVREYFRSMVNDCIQEVRTMEKLRDNPNVVSVEGFEVVEYLDDIGWDIYIRMEYLTSFLEYCSEKRLTEKEILKLGIDICKALEYCQRFNIVHRDVKPENIFVSDQEEFKLGDFGIARELERSMGALSKKGTFSYMAPEMYRGEAYDRRADLYSLGIMLYKLCNHNRLPFLSLEKQLITYHDKENALNKRMAGEQLPPPEDAAPAFGAVILRACAFQMQDRYQSAQEFRRDLEAVQRGEVPVDIPLEDDYIRQLRLSDVPGNESTGSAQDLENEDGSPGAFDTEMQNGLKTESSGSEGKPVSKRTEIPVEKLPDLWEESRKRSRKKKRKRRLDPLAALAVTLALAVLLVFSYYFYLLFGNKTADHGQGTNPAPVEVIGKAADGELADDLELVQERVNTITQELDSYNWVEDNNKRIQYYDASWQLMKVMLYPEISADGKNEEYFYWNGQLIFAYVWRGEEKDYYYYKNQTLIRWVDSEQETHDEETDNSEYMERGETYLQNAVKEMERVQNGVSD